MHKFWAFVESHITMTFCYLGAAGVLAITDFFHGEYHYSVALFSMAVMEEIRNDSK